MNLLFMRPYLTSKKILNVIKYLFKWLAILYFHLVRKFKIGILGVPFHKPKIFPSLWFDDPLLTKPNEAKLGGDQSLLRQSFGIGTDSRIILVPGFLTSRKNPELAISILDHVSKHSFDSFCLVFAGKSERTCKLQISNACHPNVFHLDKYLSDSEYRTLLNISSIVLLPYSNRGSSSIVLESLAHGKNVIITKSKIWLNAERNSQGLLHLCPLNAVSISKAIQKILQCDNSTTPVILSGQIRANIIDFLSKELF